MNGQVNQKAIFLQGSCLQVPVLTYLIIHCNLKCKPKNYFLFRLLMVMVLITKKHTRSILFNLRNQTLMLYR